MSYDTVLVSVLMTAFNREKYIAEAIESVIASSHPNFELIIVDDVSTDETVSIARAFAEKDKRITVYVNENNLGDYPNRNKAASYAKGKYIMYCDSDDKLFEDGVRQCLAAMMQFPEVPFGMYLYNYNETDKIKVLNGSDAIYRHFFQHPFLSIGPGGTIINRAFFNKIGGYPEKYGPSNDMYFNLKSVSNASMVSLPFDFMFYRRHDQQEINNSYSYLINNYAYLRDALNELPLPLTPKQISWIKKKNKRRFATNILKYYWATKSIAKTKKVIQEARFSVADFLQGVFQ